MSSSYWPLIKLVPAQTHFKFTRLAPYAAIVSGLAVLASVICFFTLGLNFGTDFKGGTLMEVNTTGPAPLAQLRTALGAAGLHDAQVQGFGSPNSALLRFRPAETADPMAGVNPLKARLSQQFPGIQFKRVEVVGAKVSGELFKSGLMALGLAILLMLVYIWFRFQLQFGLGAVIAIFHDLILTMGILSALQIEFSMTSIAALLTIIGYSMNEKVITFDRLRENLRKYKRTSLRDIIDLSENERLSRTLITGSTALLALAGMLFLGGPTLFPLVFAMVFGIVIGTYSSIYVALPIILVWGVRRGDEEPAKPLPPRPEPVAELRHPPSIDAYGGGGFRVSGQRVEGSILILDDKVQPWAVTRLADLGPDDIAAVLAAGLGVVEFVLLGVGAKIAPPPPALRQALQAAGMGLEVMDTATAARVYNVLVSEGRRLAAALIAI